MVSTNVILVIENFKLHLSIDILQDERQTVSNIDKKEVDSGEVRFQNRSQRLRHLPYFIGTQQTRRGFPRQRGGRVSRHQFELAAHGTRSVEQQSGGSFGTYRRAGGSHFVRRATCRRSSVRPTGRDGRGLSGSKEENATGYAAHGFFPNSCPAGKGPQGEAHHPLF